MNSCSTVSLTRLQQTNLKNSITDFLLATALWNPQWFNKPKFHLFVHLLEHVRRFGPAIIYSTETFESYNLVIRLRSINSNKHAPSFDIAQSFSHMHAVRHLVSGGYVTKDETGAHISPRQAGQGVRSLLQDPDFCAFMCIRDTESKRYGAGTSAHFDIDTALTGLTRMFPSTRGQGRSSTWPS